MFYPRVAKLGFIRHRGKKLLRFIRIIASDLRTQFDFATALLDELAHLGWRFLPVLQHGCRSSQPAYAVPADVGQSLLWTNRSDRARQLLQRGFNIRVRVRGYSLMS